MKKPMLFTVTFVMVLIVATFIYIAKLKPNIFNQNVQSSIKADLVSSSEKPIQTAYDKTISQEEFVKSNLEYNIAYLGLSIPNNIKESNTKVLIDSINYVDKKFTVVGQQLQICSKDRKTSPQNGYYLYKEGELVLFNEVDTSAVVEGQDCLVKIEYKISDLDLSGTQYLKLIWQDIDGKQFVFPMCYYNNTPYNNEDVFAGMNKCTTCACMNGVVTCEDNEKCIQKESLKIIETETSNI